MPPDRTHSSPRSRGLSLIEVTLAVSIFLVALVPLGVFVQDTNDAFSSLASRTYVATRGQVIMDRIVDDMAFGRFVSMTPPVPENSDYIRFQRIIGFTAGSPIFSAPIHMEFIPLESNMTDSVDNDGDGLVNEGGLRIWTDHAPEGPTPGPEDSPVVLADNLANSGLQFTRNGGSITIQLTLQGRGEAGQPPILVTLTSGAKMRNQ